MDMKRNILTIFISFLLLLSLLTVVFAFSSCGSRKQYNRLDIERLFMQTAKPEIDFVKGGGLEGKDGPRTVSEEVSFSNHGEQQSLQEGEVFASDAVKLDTTKVYKLNEVVVKVKSHFAPERDGKVNIDFDILAPVDVLDPNWRLVLTPRIIDGDSICPLDTVILTGDSFKDKQVGDYEAYSDFLSTIVSPSAYDSLFVDWKGLDKEIHKVQKRNYNDFRAQYDLMMDYENWKKMNEMEFLSMEAIAMRHKRHMYEKYWRKAENLTDKNVRKQKEPEDYHSKYVQKYEKDYVRFLKDRFSLHWVDTVSVDMNIHAQKDSVLKRSHIPRKYRNLYAKGLTIRDLKAKPFTAEDSVKIAKHHYLIDEIVLNEMNMNRKDDIFKEIVQFPYRTDTKGIRTDTVITAEENMVYTYRQPWKVRPGMKNLKVVLTSKVEAMDRTVFEFPPSDTLTYYIASLSQLAENSLATERVQLHKFMFDKITVYPKYKSKKVSKFDESSNSGIFDKLLEAYKVYSSKEGLAVDSITIQSSVDLSGDWDSNYALSQHRAESVMEYLRSKMPVHFAVTPKGEDWNTLVKEIQLRSDMPNGQEIISRLTTATYPDQTEEDIKKDFPEDYKIIKNEIYPKLERIDFRVEISRPDIEKDTVRETFREDYAEAIKLLRNGEYMPALEVLANYPDFNTALCLACMGYNDKAEDLLNKLPQAAKNEYLLAIIAVRKNDDQKASGHLIKACELDPNLYNRVSLDSEVTGLANRLSLWSKLHRD